MPIFTRWTRTIEKNFVKKLAGKELANDRAEEEFTQRLDDITEMWVSIKFIPRGDKLYACMEKVCLQARGSLKLNFRRFFFSLWDFVIFSA